MKVKDKISRLILLVPIGAIIFTFLFVLAVLYIGLNSYFEEELNRSKQKFLSEIKTTLEHRVNSGYNILKSVYEEKNKFCKRNNLSKEECDKLIINETKGIYKNLQFKNNEKIFLAKTPKNNQTDMFYYKRFDPLDIYVGSSLKLDKHNQALKEKIKEKEALFDKLKNWIFLALLGIIIIAVVVFYFISKYVRDIYEMHEKELLEEKEKFRQKSIIDPLTGLYNKEYLINAFSQIASRLRRNGKKAVIAFIDLDQFKEINDSLGHEYGDMLIKEVAKRIKKNVRKSDIVSRFGGDEFVLILDEVEKPENIIGLIQRLLESINEKIVLNGKSLSTTASIGLSVFPDDSEDINKLITYADTAMYEAKRHKGNSFEFYKKEMGEKAKEKLELKNDIKEAIKNDEFVVYYQPQIDKDGKLYGAEALVRWIHPQKGLIPPFKFIPLATELGLIDKIDEIVIRKTVNQYKKWEEEGYHIGIVSCNFTMFDIERGNLIEKIKDIVKELNFDSKNLIMEITEDSIMKNPKKAIGYIEELSHVGINIAVDDFGTGYSSLSYLNKFPLNELKIDRNFIKDLPHNEDNAKIVKTVVNLAKNFNLKTVAEGVETKEQEKYVLSLGIDLIQGYLYSPPIPANEFEEKFLKGEYARK